MPPGRKPVIQSLVLCGLWIMQFLFEMKIVICLDLPLSFQFSPDTVLELQLANFLPCLGCRRNIENMNYDQFMFIISIVVLVPV